MPQNWKSSEHLVKAIKMVTYYNKFLKNHHHTTTVLRPFFRAHPGELVPEENFCTL